MTVALYPGSFDPVTNGHVDIARRAASLFEKLIVGVYDAPPKNLLFATEERLKFFQDAVADIPNIVVQPYKGLTVQTAVEVGARVLVRGLRASSDFEFEFELAMMNRHLSPEIEVVCLMTRLDYLFLSSSLLKEAVSLGGDISHLVPDQVEQALRKKLAVKTSAGKE